MLRPYRVKIGAAIQVNGITYQGGEIVYLDREAATFHSASIDSISTITDEISPPFEAKLVAYKGADLNQAWYLEKFQYDILSITDGEITTKIPHGLSTGNKVNLRIVAETTIVNAQVIVTVLTPSTFSVPLDLPNLDNFEIGEIGIPLDLTGKTYTGGLYTWAAITTPLVFNCEFQTQVDSKRVTAKGGEIDLSQFRIGDSLKITGATDAAIESLAPIQPFGRDFVRAISLSLASTATLTTSNAIGSRQILSTETGAAVAGKVFNFAVNPQYGEIIATLDKVLLSDLAGGLYPFKIYQAQGSDDLLLFQGSCEVIS